MDLTLSSWILGLAAAFLVGFSKTGMPAVGILFVPLMAAAFPARASVAVLLPMLILGDLFAVARYRHHAQWDKLLRLLPYVFLGMLPGRFLLDVIPDGALRLLIGVLVLLLILLELARRRWGLEKMPDSRIFVALMGVTAGFATTVGNVAGPVMSVYLLSMGFDKHKFIGTGAWFYLIINVVKIPIFAQLGMLTAQTLRFDLIAAPVIVLGSLLGIYALPRIPQRLFNALILILSAATALGLIVSVLREGGAGVV